MIVGRAKRVAKEPISTTFSSAGRFPGRCLESSCRLWYKVHSDRAKRGFVHLVPRRFHRGFTVVLPWFRRGCGETTALVSILAQRGFSLPPWVPFHEKRIRETDFDRQLQIPLKASRSSMFICGRVVFFRFNSSIFPDMAMGDAGDARLMILNFDSAERRLKIESIPKRPAVVYNGYQYY